ncbi:hypothetical protein BKA62DRAFT_835982 [Auriculariales sp. MPI-PUGE-AT-0066]|nr:hypothetical protein BKA62DRAFT_835982 [Auriculariales sp. MPI-PUGE-AT-0066]
MLFLFYSAALVLATAVARGASIQCHDRISTGWLNARKNSLNGQEIPLWISDATGKLVTAGDVQNGVFVFPCTSKAIGKPATTISADNKTITVYGQMRPFSGNSCLARNLSDSSVGLAPCQTEDTLAKQQTQFWRISLDWTGGPEAFGVDKVVTFVAPGVYNHLANRQWYESTYKPPSTWYLTFTWSE